MIFRNGGHRPTFFASFWWTFAYISRYTGAFNCLSVRIVSFGGIKIFSRKIGLKHLPYSVLFHMSQKMSDIRSLCMLYMKVVDEEVSLWTLLTLTNVAWIKAWKGRKSREVRILPAFCFQGNLESLEDKLIEQLKRREKSRLSGFKSWLVEKAWKCILACRESLEMHLVLLRKPGNASWLAEKAWK